MQYSPPVVVSPYKWYRDVTFIKLSIMLCLVVCYFFAELISGMIGGSLALIADSFHMLSDAISFVIGMVSLLVCFFFQKRRKIVTLL